MTAQQETTDLSMLSWCAGEIRQALESADEAINQHLSGDGNEASPLAVARSALHQAHGALGMVNLRGTTQVTGEAETLLDRLEQGELEFSANVVNKLSAAFSAINEYLDELLRGDAEQPLRLFPYLRDLLELRQAERIHPADLFFPELVRLPAPEAEPVALLAEQASAIRGQFESGLLGILRAPADPDRLGQMADAVRQLQGSTLATGNQTFWQVAAAYFNALEKGQLELDAWGKRLLARINLQIRRTMQGGAPVADRLLRDTLFSIARGAPDAGELAAIFKAFELTGKVPADFDKPRYRGLDRKALMRANQALATMKKTWEGMLSQADGISENLGQFKLALSQFREASEGFESTGLDPLVGAWLEVAKSLGADNGPVTDAVGVEIAMSILFVEQLLVFGLRDFQDLSARAEEMAARIDAAMAGGAPDEEAPDWLQALTASVQDRLTINTFTAETQSALRETESILDNYLREPEQGEDALATAQQNLVQIGGVMRLLGYQDAASAAVRLAEQTGDIMQGERLDPEVLPAMAGSVGTLGFFLDALKSGTGVLDTFVFDAATGVFEQRILQGRAAVRSASEAEAPVSPPAEHLSAGSDAQQSEETAAADATDESAEQMLERQLGQLDAALLAWSASPDDRALALSVSELLQNVCDSAQVVEANDLLTSVQSCLELADSGTAAAPLEIAARIGRPAALCSAQLPEAPAGELPEAEEDVDEELLEIFLAEAAEVLETIESSHGELEQAPADQMVLTTVRRGFHTLKGSSRMVGLEAFGEAAWALEQVLNTWLAEEKRADDDLLRLIAQAVQVFSQWVASLEPGATRSPRPDPALLVARAEAIRAGESFDSVAAPMQPEAPAVPGARMASGGESAVAPAARGTELEQPVMAETAEAEEHAAAADVKADAVAHEPAEASVDESDSDGSASAAGIVAFAGSDVGPDMPSAGVASGAPGGVAGDTEAGSGAGAPEVPESSHRISFDDFALPESFAADEATGSDDDGGTEDAIAGEAFDFDIESRIAPDVPADAMAEESLAIGHAEDPSLGPADDLVSEGEASIGLDADAPDHEAAAEPAAEHDDLADAIKAFEGFDAQAASLPADRANLPEMTDEPMSAADDGDLFAGSDIEGVEVVEGLDIPDSFDAMDLESGADEPDGPLIRSEFSVDEMAEQAAGHDDSTNDAAVGDDGAHHDEAVEASLSAQQEQTETESPADEGLGSGVETAAETVVAGDDVVMVGDLSISRPLFNVFCEEVAQLEQVLVPDAQDWVQTPERHATEAARRAMHSLKGSAALVQVEPVRAMASALEQFLATQIASKVQVSAAEVQRYHDLVGTLFAALAEFTQSRMPAACDTEIADAEKLQARWKEVARESAAQPESRPVAIEPQPAAEDDVPAIQDELDEELLPLFIEEAEEYLPQIDENLRAWLQAPGDTKLQQLIMRQFHTVKGSARMAGAMVLGQRVHDMETTVESAMAMDEVPVSLIEELLAEQDIVSEQFEYIRDPSLKPRTPEASVDEPTAAADPAAGDSRPAQSAEPDKPAQESARAQASNPLVRVRSELLDKLVNEAGEVSIARSRLDNSIGGLRTAMNELGENVNRLRAQVRELEMQGEMRIQASDGNGKEASADFDPLEFDRFTRFQELTRMMAESVNDVGTVQANAARAIEEAFADINRQGQTVRQLQHDLMGIRMVQFGTISDRLYRVVRQVAKQLGKRVSLDIRGATMQLDRGVLEKMVAPLEHLLRNAVSHGIESPELRAKAGKPETGDIRIEVTQDGNETMIVLADDGSGLNLDKIRNRALERGLIGSADKPNDARLADMIFMPGFSTASKVDQISGRGVGMDVVRSEVSLLGGRVQVGFEPQQGTRFMVHLPVTMAIEQVMIVSVGERRYAIPSASVEQVLQFDPERLAKAYADRTVSWQDDKLPLYNCGSLVHLEQQQAGAQHVAPVIIVKSGGRRIAVHADDVSKSQEVVVKNVGVQVAKVVGIAGATLMGNGEVVLILNLGQLADQLTDSEQDAAMRAGMAAGLAEAPSTVMVVDDSVTVRKVTQRFLVREGFDVILAKDGIDALRQLEERLPDVMLVDVEMPRMDGFDLTRALRKAARTKHIPVIMITSRTADKHRNFAMSLGVNEYLGKPYDEARLLELINQYIAILREMRETA